MKANQNEEITVNLPLMVVEAANAEVAEGVYKGCHGNFETISRVVVSVCAFPV